MVENSLYKSNKKTAKSLESTFPELCKLTKGLQQHRESLLKENWMNLRKNVLLGPFLPWPFLQLGSSLEAVCFLLKTRDLAATGGRGTGFIPKELSSFDLSLVPWSPHCKAIHIGSDSELAQCKTTFSPGACFSKTILSFQAQGFHLSLDQSSSILYGVLDWPKPIKINA